MVAACSLNLVNSAKTCCSSFGEEWCFSEFPGTLTDAEEFVLLTICYTVHGKMRNIEVRYKEVQESDVSKNEDKRIKTG